MQRSTNQLDELRRQRDELNAKIAQAEETSNERRAMLLSDVGFLLDGLDNLDAVTTRRRKNVDRYELTYKQRSVVVHLIHHDPPNYPASDTLVTVATAQSETVFTGMPPAEAVMSVIRSLLNQH